jgi:hypothetical protein
MNRLSGAHQEKTTAPVQGDGILQRKCDCGNHTVAGGECAECSKKQMLLQRATQNSESDTQNSGGVPPIVHDVLRSSGQPLDTATRSFFEPRFGHDFSQVRVHLDEPSSRSAQAVNALAYTVGNHLVFGANSYQPATGQGRGLLAHELAHVVQQNNDCARKGSLTISAEDHPAEREADAAANAIATDRAALVGTQHSSSLVQRQPPTKPAKPVTPKAPAAAAATGSFAVKMSVAGSGVEGTIEFSPDAKNCPKCKLIRLVQIVRVFEKPGVDYKWTGTEANRDKYKTKEDAAKTVKPNFFVDQLAAKCAEGKKCSIYYREPENPSNSQDGSNDGVTSQKATLWDGPSGDADDVNEFETCARCHDTGTYLRCVDWGYSVDGKGKASKSTTSEHASPSATFTAAISAFDKFYKN